MSAIDSAGAGPPLVLLHGVATSRVIWRRALPLLAMGRRAVAVDLPGFGDAAPAGRGFDLDDVAAAVARTLDGQVERPFDLVGNSLGGAVAVALAATRPDLVRRLVLAAPAGFTPYPAAVSWAAGVVAAGLVEVRSVVGPPLAGIAAARRVLLWNAVADPGALGPADARTMLCAARGSTRIADAIAAVMAEDLRPRLRALDVPWGLLWGERDLVVPISTLRTLRALAPHAPVETLPGVGHVPHIESPRDFAAALERLLERLGPVTAP